MDDVKICEGISDISDSYSGFLIDQFGTLHNGTVLYDHTIETLKNLRHRGKKIILLSNSGQRAAQNKEFLKSIGLHDTLYDHIVTSAELMRIHLNNREEGPLKGLGNKCFLMTRQKNAAIADDVDDVTVTETMEEADFILLTGSEAPEKTLENYYDGLLRIATKRRLKMICANPEKTMTMNGQVYMGSGEIARRYEEFGGVVTYIGKPFPSIFQHALGLFDDLYPSQICMIGDSLANDIRGARYLDMDCALVASGTHAGSFSKVQSTADIHKMLKILGKNFGTLPTYFIPRFHWGKALPDRKNKRKGG